VRFFSWHGGSGVAATRECVVWKPSRSSGTVAKRHGLGRYVDDGNGSLVALFLNLVALGFYLAAIRSS
jgi:hypothetical protein